jgi:hypothetical protein
VRRREDVDDAAAHAPLADLDDGVDALVAARVERLEQQFAIEVVADGDAQHVAGERVGRRQRGIEAGQRDDDDERLAGEQSPADRRALGVGFTVVAAPPEPWLGLGKLHRRGAEELQILGEAVRLGDAGGDDQHRARLRFPELRDDERPGRAGEAGDTADVSLGK